MFPSVEFFGSIIIFGNLSLDKITISTAVRLHSDYFSTQEQLMQYLI